MERVWKGVQGTVIEQGSQEVGGLGEGALGCGESAWKGSSLIEKEKGRGK